MSRTQHACLGMRCLRGHQRDGAFSCRWLGAALLLCNSLRIKHRQQRGAGCPITSVFFFGVTCVFFLGVAGVFFFGVAAVFFVVRKQSSESPFWPALGCRSGFTPGFGLSFLRVSVLGLLFLELRPGFIVFRVAAFFQACLRIFQGIGLGVLRFHYGLSFIRVRCGFTPFKASAWV